VENHGRLPHAVSEGFLGQNAPPQGKVDKLLHQNEKRCLSKASIKKVIRRQTTQLKPGGFRPTPTKIARAPDIAVLGETRAQQTPLCTH
jgi:hypothetical protein